MSAQPVRRLEHLPEREEFQAEYVEPGVPVVLAGAVRGWKASTAWTPEYLRRAIGEQAFFYRTSSSNAHPANPSKPDEARGGHSTFSEYLDLILAPGGEGARHYLTGEQTLFFDKGLINSKLEPLLDDFEAPALYDEAALQYVGFWASAQGVVSWLHYDANGCHNLNAQVAGRKRVRLFAPEHAAALAPYSASALGPHTFSQVDVRQPDLARFPDFAHVASLETVLEAGDLLFLPAFWWHSFAHEGELNLNVNFWWARGAGRVSATSLQWAFAHALSRALGKGREGLPPAYLAAALERLPPEARSFCSELERELMRTLEADPHRAGE